MNENIRKVFNLLGVEPNEKFRIGGLVYGNNIFTIDENLTISDDRETIYIYLLASLLRGDYKIIKFSKKKKLRDLTEDEFLNWKRNNCGNCKNCIFRNVICTCAGKYESLWVECKELYSDAFLNQEIEVKE